MTCTSPCRICIMETIRRGQFAAMRRMYRATDPCQRGVELGILRPYHSKLWK